eukprot:6500587-Alexandrium_andersonii.AAC.1
MVSLTSSGRPPLGRVCFVASARALRSTFLSGARQWLRRGVLLATLVTSLVPLARRGTDGRSICCGKSAFLHSQPTPAAPSGPLKPP